MLCSSQAPGRLLARAEQDFLADMHQLHTGLGVDTMRRTSVFPSFHGFQPAGSPEPAEQEDPLASRSVADMSSREIWKGRAGPSSPDSSLRGTLFPPYIYSEGGLCEDCHENVGYCCNFPAYCGNACLLLRHKGSTWS